jgi:hypothetical protein
MVGGSNKSKNVEEDMSLDEFINHLKGGKIPQKGLYKKGNSYQVIPIKTALDKITGEYKKIEKEFFNEYHLLQSKQKEVASANKRIKQLNKTSRIKEEKIKPLKIKLTDKLEQKRYNNLIEVYHVLGVINALKKGRIAGVKIPRLWSKGNYFAPHQARAERLKYCLQRLDLEFKKSYDSWKRLQNARTYQHINNT